MVLTLQQRTLSKAAARVIGNWGSDQRFIDALNEYQAKAKKQKES